MTLFCRSDANNPGNKLFLLFSSGTNLTEKFVGKIHLPSGCGVIMNLGRGKYYNIYYDL